MGPLGRTNGGPINCAEDERGEGVLKNDIDELATGTYISHERVHIDRQMRVRGYKKKHVKVVLLPNVRVRTNLHRGLLEVNNKYLSGRYRNLFRLFRS